MIAHIDSALRPMGVSAPIRFTLIMQLVKLKLTRPMDGQKIQLNVKAMDSEKKVEVFQQDEIKIGQDGQNSFLGADHQSTDVYYSINKRLEFDLSYGVTKVSIKGFYVKRLGGKSLAFFNDLSLKKVLDTEQMLKYECHLLGEGKTHVASLFVHLQRQGDATPRYNVFAEVANRIKINQQQFLA